MANPIKQIDTMSCQDEIKLLDTKGKACLFNLVLYIHDMRRLEYFQDLVHSIVEKFPCRVLMIKGYPDKKEPFLKACVFSIPSGSPENPLFCDQLVVEASSSSLSDVHYLIVPQLVPDLPVHLIWAQDPTKENDILPHLEKFATRLIFDSECTSHLTTFGNQMLQKMKALKYDVMDMNWARFQGWRTLFAQAFDSPKKLQTLRSAQQLTIEYNAKECASFHHHEIQAFYMQAWLATQLNWKQQSLEKKDLKHILNYTLRKHHIKVILNPGHSDTFGPGAILDFKVHGSDGHEWSFIRTPHQPNYVRIETSSPEACQVPYMAPLSSHNRTFAFVREILYTPMSDHYTAMLHTISQTDEASK